MAEDGSTDDGRSAIPALGFLRAIADSPVSPVAIATALVILLSDPVQFVREYIIDGLLVFLVETVIRGFFGLLGRLSAELQLVATQFWNATFGMLIDTGGGLMRTVVLPIVTGIQAMMVVGLESLGIAAPFAAAISVFVTMLLVSILAIIILEVLRWLLPIDALLQPVVNTVQGARSIAARLPLLGSRGDS